MYIYQHDRFIATCGPVARYNENTAEQTEADRAAYTEQAKYVARFDKMMRDGKIHRVGMLRKEEARAVADIKAEAADVRPRTEDDDYSAYLDVAHYEAEAVAKI